MTRRIQIGLTPWHIFFRKPLPSNKGIIRSLHRVLLEKYAEEGSVFLMYQLLTPDTAVIFTQTFPVIFFAVVIVLKSS